MGGRKRRGKGKEEIEVREFEDDFKEIYGVSWDSWIAVKRDILGDGEPLTACITGVFADMYRTMQEIDGVKK
ncbi:MAG: hypothetical protein NC409_11060 [Clostridium sp.]|nr:hypothetical protein [Clostridium sp.]